MDNGISANVGDSSAEQRGAATDHGNAIDRNAPILVFDSGVGGLSVLDAIRKKLPNAPIVYAADHAFLPYGDKSESEIATRVPALLGRLVERYRPRLAVIACNTACTIALTHIRAALNIPVVGTVPAIKPAAQGSESKIIGLLGTKATIRQPYVDQLQADHAKDCTLIRHAAPQLVQAAEAKLHGQQISEAIYAEAIAGLAEQKDGLKIDKIILGCTHFPLLESELRAACAHFAFHHEIEFVDGAAGIARRIDVLTQGQGWPESAPPGIFVSSADAQETDRYQSALTEFGLNNIEQL